MKAIILIIKFFILNTSKFWVWKNSLNIIDLFVLNTGPISCFEPYILYLINHILILTTFLSFLDIKILILIQHYLLMLNRKFR